MKITLNGGKTASKEALDKLEAAIGSRISASFRRFVSKHDGLEPDSNRFKVGNDNHAGVDQFIPVCEILEERKYIDNIPIHAYPIACASCGNYVLLDEGQGGHIYFWDHELPEDNIIKVADNFDQFLSMLEPFDVELKPEQVKSVWIDPDFLKHSQDQRNKD